MGRCTLQDEVDEILVGQDRAVFQDRESDLNNVIRQHDDQIVRRIWLVRQLDGEFSPYLHLDVMDHMTKDLEGQGTLARIGVFVRHEIERAKRIDQMRFVPDGPINCK